MKKAIAVVEGISVEQAHLACHAVDYYDDISKLLKPGQYEEWYADQLHFALMKRAFSII